MTGIRINMPDHYMHVSDVPVRIEVRDAALNLVETTWVPFGQATEVDVPPGFYVVEAELPSGRRMQEALQVSESEMASVDMDTGDLSPHEFHAWAYLTRDMTRAPVTSLSDAIFEGAWMRLWHKDTDEWQTVSTELGGGSTWDGDGVNYEFESYGGTQFLQVGGPTVPWKLIALPGSQDFRVLIRPTPGPIDEVHPLDVTVATHNAGAEAILSLLTSGAIERAKQLENAGAAEMMLYGKIADPSAAAIGGYYLLKTGDLDRLHNWTENLANWIDWMADGPVIRAWHVLKDAQATGTDKNAARKTARDYFLGAVERGIPIYTEGLRLLRDGLNILSYDRDDAEVQTAKTQVDLYAQACDWSAPTTTFLGAAPGLPSPEPIYGKPESLQDTAFLFEVDTPELIRQGILSEGATLSLAREDGPQVEVSVEADGQLNLDGKLYKSLKDVASSVGIASALQQDWQNNDTGASIYQGLEFLRHGKMSQYEK